MKKNLELTYNEKDLKLNKKNYITIIIPIVLLVVITIGIAIFVLITNNPSNKMKKYLNEIGYTCNKKTCTKEIDGDNYTINYKDITMYVENDIYRLKLNEDIPSLELKNDEFICTYTKPNYTRFTLIDNSFIFEKKCTKYIEEVNKHIEKYKEIVNSSDVDVNQ
jgi:hypothetical protein